MPNGTDVAGRRVRRQPRRRDARAAEHVPAPARARGPAAHRRRRAPRAACRGFLGRDYLADLAAISPDARARPPPDGRRGAAAAVDHGVGRRPCPGPATSRRAVSWSTRSTRRCARPTTSPSSSPRAAAAHPKGVIHTHGGALGATAAGLGRAAPRARRPALHPDAVLLGRRVRHRPPVGAGRRAPRCSPRPARSPSARCRSSNASRSRCSGAGPTRRPRSPATRASPAPTSLAASGQPRRGAARRRCRPPPGHAREPARHDRVVRPLHRRSASTRRCRRARREAAAGRSTTSRCGSSTSTPVRRSPTGRIGEIQLRGPNMMRGICGRTRAEVFTDDGFYPTGDLGHLDADGYLFLTGRRDDMFKVRGATVYPSEVEAALHTIDDVRRAYVVDVDAAASPPRSPPRGAGDGSSTRSTTSHARRPRHGSARSRCRTQLARHRPRRRADDVHRQGRQGRAATAVRVNTTDRKES